VTPRAILERLLESLGIERPAGYRGLRGKGQAWERLAARRLESEGYRILDRNFRGRSGEIDFVADEKGTLCFIEVKGRAGSGFGSPAEAVTLEKQRRIFRTAQEYLARRRLGSPACRFDVVTIVEDGERSEIEIVRHAFEEPGGRSSSR